MRRDESDREFETEKRSKRVRVCARVCVCMWGVVSLTHSGFLFSSLCHEAQTNTQEDVGSSEEEFMEEEEEDRDKDCLSEEDLAS